MLLELGKPMFLAMRPQTAAVERLVQRYSSHNRTMMYNRINSQIESGPIVIKDLSISIGVERVKLNDEAKTDINDFLDSTCSLAACRVRTRCE